jgi:hypothetical protein
MHAGTHRCGTDDLQWTKPWLVDVWHISYQIFKDAATNLNAKSNCLESHILSFPKVLQIPPESPCICLRRDSNPEPHKASGRTPTAYTARRLSISQKAL